MQSSPGAVSPLDHGARLRDTDCNTSIIFDLGCFLVTVSYLPFPWALSRHHACAKRAVTVDSTGIVCRGLASFRSEEVNKPADLLAF